ncbi:MAG: FkbM family methyltransferase [Ignavibacteriales bacterium]|nr:FkbM family methyltransferase [Ignavibacteriales bacterium]
MPLNKSLLKPIAYPNLIRLGPDGDGGYVIPEDQITSCSLLLSLGLSDNWDFDKEFLARNPKVRIVGVDHTIGRWWFLRRIFIYSWKVFMYALLFNRRKREKYRDKVRGYLEYFTFFREPHIHLKRRISSNSGTVDIQLGEILDSHNAQHLRHDVFLKMDIEGAEYDTTQDIIKHHHRIRCITGEFHDLDTRTNDFNKCMASLSQHFSVLHVHGNNGAPYDNTNDFPSVVELTLINKEVLGKKVSFSLSEYPRKGLDFPNNSAVPDYSLRFE